MTEPLPTLAQILGDSLLTSLLPLVGIVLILASLMMAIRKRRQRQGQQITAREQLERMKQEKAVRGDLEHLMVELEQLTKRFGAQLDAKATHLEKLLAEADERIAELRRLQGDGETSEVQRDAWHAADPWRSPQAATAPESEDDALARQVYELADQGLAPLDIARRLNEHVGKVELVLALRKV